MEFEIIKQKKETVSVSQILEHAGVTEVKIPFAKNGENFIIDNGKKVLPLIYEGKVREDGSQSNLCGNVQVKFGETLIVEIPLSHWEGGNQSNRLKTTFRLNKPTETVTSNGRTYRNNLRPFATKGQWVGVGNTRSGKPGKDGMTRQFASVFLSEELFLAIEHYIDETLASDMPVVKHVSKEMFSRNANSEQEAQL